MIRICYILVIALCSCNSQSSNELSGKDKFRHEIDLERSIHDDALNFTPESYIQLKLPKDFIGFSETIRMKSIGEFLFVFDIEQQILMQFDSLGNHVRSIGKEGRGPNELTHVLDFSIYEDTISFFRPMGDRVSILKFGMDGNYYSRIETSTTAMSFEQIGNGDYIVFTGWNVDRSPDRLLKLNLKGDIKDSFHPHDISERKISIEDITFSLGENQVYFNETLRPEIFRIDESNNLVPFAYIYMDKYSLGDEFWEQNSREAAEGLFENGFYHCRYFWVTNKFILLEGVAISEGGKDQKYIITLMDINSGQTKSKVIEAGTLNQQYLNIISIENENLLTLTDGYLLSKNGIENINGKKVSESSHYIMSSKVIF